MPTHSLCVIRQFKPRLRGLGLCLCLTVCLVGCQGVDFVLNEQVVYTDADLFTDYEIPDPGLKGCVERAILAGRLTAATQLRDLHCIEAGVVSLTGLTQFPNLQRLDLTGNHDLSCIQVEKFKSLDELILPDQCR